LRANLLVRLPARNVTLWLYQSALTPLSHALAISTETFYGAPL
jgi:hypothetical protein